MAAEAEQQLSLTAALGLAVPFNTAAVLAIRALEAAAALPPLPDGV